MIKTKGILHVTIPVSDLARSRAFYTEILGLEFVAQVPKENPHFVFLKSGADYVIPTWPNRQPPPGKKWVELTQGPRDVDPAFVGREALFSWEAKIYALAPI